MENDECRICFLKESYDNRFITPCLCKGYSKYIHRKCLNEWREINVGKEAYMKCMECNYEYNIDYEYPIEKTNYCYKNYVPYTIMLHILSFVASLCDIAFSDTARYNYNTAKIILFVNKTQINEIGREFYPEDHVMFFFIYYCIYYFAFSFLSQFCYGINNIVSIHNKDYLVLNIKNEYFNLLFTKMLFFMLYNLIVSQESGFVLFSMSIFYIIIDSKIFLNLVKKHLHIINTININNTEKILPYIEDV